MPRDRMNLMICTGTGCVSNGAFRIKDTLEEELVKQDLQDEVQVITTGCNLPFDSDGPWRVQCAHLRAWQAWWKEARHKMPPGRWYLDGTAIG